MNVVATSLAELKSRGTYRNLQATRQGVIDFSSNDYLGLSQCTLIKQKLVAALNSECPLGATGSRLLSGHSKWHERVESFLARAYCVESALLFSSGFLANMGTMYAFGVLNAHFFSDEAIHASSIDGMRLCKTSKSIYRHCDLSHLESLLAKSNAPTKVIVTESVFSMNGDLLPVESILELAKNYQAWLIVDEAHATGLFGECGLGRLTQQQRTYDKLVAIHTAGKALGGQGAYVLSNEEFRIFLINTARSFIYSTALAPISALQIEYAIESIMDRPERGQMVLKKAEAFRKSLCIDSYLARSQSQIVPVVLGSNERVIKASQHLDSLNCNVRAIRSPTVPNGTERLRVTINYTHTDEDLAKLAQALNSFSEKPNDLLRPYQEGAN